MAGLESSMDLADAARKIKKPKVSKAESERQKAFLEQLRARKPVKVKASKQTKAKARSGKGKKMTRAKKGETYYCTVCGCEVMCTTSSESPIVCCDEEMCVIV
jgi:FKBP-type peptidyl-prolyl cis-trans isomerase